MDMLLVLYFDYFPKVVWLPGFNFQTLMVAFGFSCPYVTVLVAVIQSNAAVDVRLELCCCLEMLVL